MAHYDEPYKIQRMAIPVGLSNRDCVGIAETGSGKTAAFVLPMLVYVLRQPPMNSFNFEDGPYALVLAPTRELAKQIEEETNKFATHVAITAITIVGGVNHDAQSGLLREGCEVIIATPGRLLDCIDRRILVLNQCNYVVLDEADRMIDMGFEPQVNAIFEKMPSSNLRPLDEDLTMGTDPKGDPDANHGAGTLCTVTTLYCGGSKSCNQFFVYQQCIENVPYVFDWLTAQSPSGKRFCFISD